MENIVYGMNIIAHIVLAVFIYASVLKALNWLWPFDIHREIAEDKNLAVGIVIASIILGLSLIIVAVIITANYF